MDSWNFEALTVAVDTIDLVNIEASISVEAH